MVHRLTTLFTQTQTLLLLCFVFFASFFAFTSFALAQISIPSTGFNNPLSLEIRPEFPEPGDVVTITVKSLSVDLNRSDILWKVNGKNVAEGAGGTSTEILMGKAGSQSNVSVFVNTQNQGVVSTEVTLRPAHIDLLWEAKTYTPPFYKGKALPTSKSILKLVAIPEFIGTNGKKYPASDLIYTWKEGYKVLGSLSGRGRNTLEIESAWLFNDLDISVEVESVDNALSAKKKVLVPAQSPQILFYEDHPTQGVLFEKSIENTFNLTEEEITFVAIPLFFTGEKRDDTSFTYLWSANNREIFPAGGDQSVLTLRPEEGSAGISTIGLSVRTAESILQEARSRFSIQFNNTLRSSSF